MFEYKGYYVGFNNSITNGGHKNTMGVLSNKQKADEYRQLAYQCVANEAYNTCNRSCVNCPLNISLFVDDQKEAVLIKMSAMRDYQRDQANEQALNQLIKKGQEQRDAEYIGTLIAAAIPIGFIIWCISSIQSCFAG
jgi:hypothetical protein